MIAYLDSSVLPRVVLGQRDRLTEWGSIRRAVASAIAEVECLRTLDRLRIRHSLSDHEIATRREATFRLLGELEIVEVGRPVLSRAAQPFPTPLGTLDAIHLATALLFKEANPTEVLMATHDSALALASRACGMTVIGEAA